MSTEIFTFDSSSDSIQGEESNKANVSSNSEVEDINMEEVVNRDTDHNKTNVKKKSRNNPTPQGNLSFREVVAGSTQWFNEAKKIMVGSMDWEYDDMVQNIKLIHHWQSLTLKKRSKS